MIDMIQIFLIFSKKSSGQFPKKSFRGSFPNDWYDPDFSYFFQKIIRAVSQESYLPIGSMYGIYTYIYHKNQPNVGKYTKHGSYGLDRDFHHRIGHSRVRFFSRQITGLVTTRLGGARHHFWWHSGVKRMFCFAGIFGGWRDPMDFRGLFFLVVT